MDPKLIAWARAVKARRRHRSGYIPPLWVFTDQDRLPDPRAVLAALPKNLCGVVLRAGRGVDPVMALSLARLCRQRRFMLVVAGDPALAARLGAGQHAARGWRRRNRQPPVTASAHNRAELLRAAKIGAEAVFLSPIFPTASHPGARTLGGIRWAALARQSNLAVMALGGITERTVRRLPFQAAGVGVIGAARLAFSLSAG